MYVENMGTFNLEHVNVILDSFGAHFLKLGRISKMVIVEENGWKFGDQECTRYAYGYF